eukprot:COSAG06_NODE_27889_length_584_cov_1.527835_1_plen_53_part_10
MSVSQQRGGRYSKLLHAHGGLNGAGRGGGGGGKTGLVTPPSPGFALLLPFLPR